MARRTKEDAQATRQALLDAAERVFEQRGVSRTSLAEVAVAAGVTRGAVYWHFKDKADLFNAMMERVILPFDAELAALPDADGDPIDALVERLQRSMARIASDAQTQRVLAIAKTMVEHVEEMAAVREQYVRNYRVNVGRMVQALQAAGARRGQRLPAPAEQLAEGLHAMVRGLVQGWLLERSFDLPTTAAVAVQAYLTGIGMPPQSAPSARAPRNRG